MAGSFKHVTDDDGNYTGLDLLENGGDRIEALEEMAFMLLDISHRWAGEAVVEQARARYYECLRGDRAWPTWWKSE